MTAASFDVASWLSGDNHKRPVPVKRPHQITCWTRVSSTKGGAYLYGDASGLSVLSPPSLPADLNEGYPDSFIRKPAGDAVSVEVVVNAALHAGAELQGASVVTFRNNLNKILGTPLDVRNGWSVDACYHQGTLYLDIVKNDSQEGPDADRFTYYGYKFESLATRPANAGAEEEEAGVVDSTSEFATLVRLKLGQHSILMAAEIDCIDTQTMEGQQDVNQLPQLQGYVELKTCKRPEHPGQERTLHAHKYPRWWLQSFLAGVPSILLGKRDAQGMLLELERLDVGTLPSTSATRGARWDAWQLLRFGDDVLTWMITHAQQRAPGQHLRFEFAGSSDGIPQQRGTNRNQGAGRQQPLLITCRVLPEGHLPGLLTRVVPQTAPGS